jgi:hypothetical protein
MQHVLAALLATSLAVSQVPTGKHVVATQLPGGNPATQLLLVDGATGAPAALPRFPSDVHAPLALALDPFDRHVVLAVDLGGGLSRIVRLVPAGAALQEHVVVASTPGPVVDVVVPGERMFLAVDGPAGGVFSVPRRGGAPALVRAQANVTAVQSFFPSAVLMAFTGRPGTAAPDSGTEMIDATSGATFYGPSTFPNPTGRTVTGVVDMPTGLPRQLLSFDDGTFGMIALGLGLVAVPANPPPPNGGAAAMKPADRFGATGRVLGGAPFPFLYDVDPWTGAVTVLSQPLPGAPRDFDSAIPARAQWLTMSERCGAVTLTHVFSGFPVPGTQVGIGVRSGPPGQLAILAAGFGDFSGGALPAVLPGGCLLHVAPDAVLWHLLDATGAAMQNLAIPPAGYLGTILFTQWLHLGGGVLSGSEAMSMQIGT